VFTPWRWATLCTVTPGTSVSATSLRFASSDHRRRGCPRKISTRDIPPPKDWSHPSLDQSQRLASARRYPPEAYAQVTNIRDAVVALELALRIGQEGPDRSVSVDGLPKDLVCSVVGFLTGLVGPKDA
jgi:hypothetical protein